VRYIAVIHGWHVQSNGFDVHNLKSTNEDDAYAEALLLMHKRQSTFDKCDFQIIEIGGGEFAIRRKLTLKERVIGRITS
jgi:hypothetical protein